MQTKLTTAVVLCLVLGGATVASAQPQQPTGSWSNETSGQNFRFGGFGSDGTYMYLFGGYQYGVTTSYPLYYRATRRYDPSSNTWTTMAYSTQPVYYNAGAYHNGYLYSFGGYNPSYGYWNGIMRYSIASNSWVTLGATLSGPRYQLAAAVLNDRIYVIGGYYAGYSYANDEFNPATGTVTARAGLLNNQGRYYLGASSVPALGKLYIFGGLLNGQQSNSCHEYTPPSSGTPNGAWAAKANMPGTRYGCVAVTVNNRPYVIGGYNAGYSNTTFEYNPFTDSWTERDQMTYGRYLHAGVALANKIYAYGGYSSYTTCEEFTPPDFGLPPNIPTAVVQAGSRPETANQSQADATQIDGWTNNQVVFSADVTDPNEGQQVRFRVQVKPQSASWSQASQVESLATSFGSQGIHTLSFQVPADGGYDWRWRVEDAYSNSHPIGANEWIDAFGTVGAPNENSPDFRSDQVSPTDPVAVSPSAVDIQVPDPASGPVLLRWEESQDNGPVTGIEYELQVAKDGGFLDIESQLFSPAGTSDFPVTLSVSRYEKFWRIRAQDIGGNLSQWSEPLTFRVTHNDGIDHSAGDAKKACGFAAGGSPGLLAALAALALLAGAWRGVRTSVGAVSRSH